MSESIEIRWTPELRAALVDWLLYRGQLTTVCPESPTPDVLWQAVRLRKREAEQAILELRTVLEGATVPTLDLDVMDAMARMKRVALLNPATEQTHE